MYGNLTKILTFKCHILSAFDNINLIFLLKMLMRI